MVASAPPSNGLRVNSIYPVPYFSLTGVDPVRNPDQYWWSSRQRFAAEDSSHQYLAESDGGTITSEYLEIDLGRLREINHISFSIMRMPINVSIEFDQLSTGDQVHDWVSVTPLDGMDYDHQIHYDANAKSAWFAANYYFANTKGQMVQTRYLRLRFRRRDVIWPTKLSKPFRWPVSVKNLRSGRYIAGIADTVGPVFDTGVGSATASLGSDVDNTSLTLRQQFALPLDLPRVDQRTGHTVEPKLMGVGFLVNVTPTPDASATSYADAVSLQWSIYDVTTTTPTLVKSGVVNGALDTGRVWIDAYWSTRSLVQTDSTNPRVYELRLRSMNTVVVNSVVVSQIGDRYAVRPPGISLDGVIQWTHGLTKLPTSKDVTATLSAGDWIRKASGVDGTWRVASLTASSVTLTNAFTGLTEDSVTEKVLPLSVPGEPDDYSRALCMRLWGDVGSSGRDVLGNYYRHATQHDEPTHVFNDEKVGWISAPQPSADAVEALYFDVRRQDSKGQPQLQTLDALRCAPQTPGIRMVVYYCDTALKGLRPETTDDWDNLMWQPLNVVYTLRARQTLVFPRPIKAAFIKLEFSNLQPRPYQVAARPAHPPVKYRRYPTWIEQQFSNSAIRRTVQDWFLRNKTPVEIKVLETLKDPIQEFQYKERQFLAALALGDLKKPDLKDAAKNGLTITNKSIIDPVTAAKITFQTTSFYKGTLIAQVQSASVLGQVINSLADPNSIANPVEGEVNFSDGRGIQEVSTSNDRIAESFAYLAQTPMWFNRLCRHHYRVDKAQFRRKAYYAGINFLEFLKQDYVVARDDDLIVLDPAHSDWEADINGEIIDSNSQFEQNSFLPDTPSRIQALLQEDPLTGVPTQSVNLLVTYQIGGQTFTNEPITLSSSNVTATGGYIQLANTGAAFNFVVTNAATGEVYQLGRDFDISLGVDITTGETTNSIHISARATRFVAALSTSFSDRSTVQAVGFASAQEIFIFQDPNSPYGSQLSTVTGRAVMFATFVQGYGDTATATAVAVLAAADSYGTSDTGTARAISDESALEIYERFGDIITTDTGTVTAVTAASSTQAYAGIDSAQVSSVAVPTDTDSVDFIEPVPTSTPIYTAVSLHLATLGADSFNTALSAAAYPDLNAIETWTNWSTLMPDNSSFVWPSGLDDSFDNAAALNYRIPFRVATGIGAPTWMFTDPVSPVDSIHLIATEGVISEVTVPVPWDANLLYWYQQLLNNLAVKFHPTNASGLTPGGTRRSDIVYHVPVSMPSLFDTEMLITTGTNTTYSSSLLASISPSLTSTATTITLAGTSDLTNWPTGQHLAKIDSECILITSRSGNTLTVSNRGWSGTVAAGHVDGARIRHADETTTYGTAAVNGIFEGQSGIFETVALNSAQWNAKSGGLALSRSNTTTAWQNAIAAHVTTLPALSHSVQYGSLFGDAYAAAKSLMTGIIQTNGIWVIAPDMQPGRDINNNPVNDGGSTSYYEGADFNRSQALDLAVASQLIIGIQMAPAAVFAQFANPYAGPSSAFRTIVEDALTRYAPEFMEVSVEILTSGS